MPTAPRNRDCIALAKGDSITVTVSDDMVESGWQGGIGVQWMAPTDGVDEFKVEISDGYYAGFLLWGSSELGDKNTSMSNSQQTYKYATLCAGGWLIMTTAFEKYTWASRQAGPLVENVYVESDKLVFGLRGLWTREDEQALSGGIPNEYFIGFVCQVPSADNSYYVTIQTSI